MGSVHGGGGELGGHSLHGGSLGPGGGASAAALDYALALARSSATPASGGGGGLTVRLAVLGKPLQLRRQPACSAHAACREPTAPTLPHIHPPRHPMLLRHQFFAIN
jgi:hypothetical protein